MARGKKTFTLIELIVSITLFAIIFITAGGAFYSVLGSWSRQRNTIEMLQNARWAADFMVNELRQGGNFSAPNGGVQRVRFEIDTDGDGSLDTRVWYWRGDSASDGAEHGDKTYLYRGIGHSIHQAYLARKQLASFVASNLSGNRIFSLSSDKKQVTIELSVRPDPYRPAGHLNHNFTVMTDVEKRN